MRKYRLEGTTRLTEKRDDAQVGRDVQHATCSGGREVNGEACLERPREMNLGKKKKKSAGKMKREGA